MLSASGMRYWCFWDKVLDALGVGAVSNNGISELTNGL